MNPLELRIQELENKVRLLEASSTIPLPVDRAFRDRFKIDDFTTLAATTKTVGSETQAVNEAGAASYDVPKIMDGLVETTLGGVTIYLPYYG